jgi:hypothetical protein
MSGSAAYTFAVVCEAAADLRLAADLADRILCQEVKWIDPENLDLYRQWRGLELTDSNLEWHWVYRLAKKQNLRAHGHFRGEPGVLDAALTRKALLLFAKSRHPPDAIILSCDTDDKEERRRGLEQARSASQWPFAIILAVAHTKRECWVLAGSILALSQRRVCLLSSDVSLGSIPACRLRSLQQPRRMLCGTQSVFWIASWPVVRTVKRIAGRPVI